MRQLGDRQQREQRLLQLLESHREEEQRLLQSHREEEQRLNLEHEEAMQSLKQSLRQCKGEHKSGKGELKGNDFKGGKGKGGKGKLSDKCGDNVKGGVIKEQGCGTRTGKSKSKRPTQGRA